MAKEREIPCMFYVCEKAECRKGRKNVEHRNCCQTCKKYRARKTGNVKKESISSKRNKAKEKEMKKQIQNL